MFFKWKHRLYSIKRSSVYTVVQALTVILRNVDLVSCSLPLSPQRKV